MKDFAKPVSPRVLNIDEKRRSNLFAWRGQFSPQLIESLLDAYCPEGSQVLDPFAGSGTVLFEAARKGLPAFGFEINPSAWSFSKIYEFAHFPPPCREAAIAELYRRIKAEFPLILFSEEVFPPAAVEEKIIRMGEGISDDAVVLCNALVVLLDIFNHPVYSDRVHTQFLALAKRVRELPFSPEPVKADLQDARCLPLENRSVDFAVTSPPYINVFNYHQNYRRSAEMLGWDLLRVARSEIGSNRANRGNRFYTVVQYCIDMARALRELARVLKPGGRAVLIVGYESNVLGVPFYNADMIERIAEELGVFDRVLRQQRVFKNRFGRRIREDILNLSRQGFGRGSRRAAAVGRDAAKAALEAAMEKVSEKNRGLLENALARVPEIGGTMVFDGFLGLIISSATCQILQLLVFESS